MIKILDYTEKPLTFIGRCVGNCYGSNIEDDKKNYKRGKQCVADGHGRVLEYPDVTMEIDGYSVKVIRELYTHIIGTTRTQESTRYVNLKQRGYFTPPLIEQNEVANQLYTETMNKIFESYQILTLLGVPKEDASMLLPLGMKTKIVFKINARALLHMAELRMCSRAYHEFRQLMKEIKNELSGLDEEWAEIADMMKPRCEIVGYCVEHECCGRKPKKVEYDDLRKRFKALETKYSNANEKLEKHYRSLR